MSRSESEQPQTDSRSDDSEAPGPVLDIGLYIGALVGIYGVILLVYRLVGSPDNSKSLGHPFDIWWGAVMIGVGAVVAGAALGGKRARSRSG